MSFKTKEIASILGMGNIEIDSETLGCIRRLTDFDLTMLISEIHDHGWAAGKKLIPMMVTADIRGVE